MMRTSLLSVVSSIAAIVLLACGGDSGSSPTEPTSSASSPPTAGPPPLPCPQAEPATSRTTYYVATNEPGADNERCDGLAPTDQGGGRCPFENFESGRTFRLLRDGSGLRVEVRGGTYNILNEGLTVSGAGGGRVVLTAYEEEPVVFDGGSVVRELVRVSGVAVTVERITLQNAGAHNIEVRGGSGHIIQCNRFLENRASDSLKGTGGAEETTVRNNEFSQWDSQAIDLTGVTDWTIIDNVFRDPSTADGNAIGAKLGTRNVRIVRNRFERTGGLSFGGVGASHNQAFEAFGLVAERNTFDDVTGVAVKFYSCSGCSVRDNDIRGAGAGLVLGGEQAEGPSGCAGGCLPTRGTVVTGNRFRDLRGGVEGSPDVFWFVNASERAGLVSGNNLYCYGAGGRARFIFAGDTLTFTEWSLRVGTDGTSEVAAEGEAACTMW